eukprot:173270-Chlamydomonas_euryale.AAC.1
MEHVVSANATLTETRCERVWGVGCGGCTRAEGRTRAMTSAGDSLLGAATCLLYTSDAADDTPCVDL